MKVALAADHAGFALKNSIASFVADGGHEVLDLGAFDDAPSDYPDHAARAGLCHDTYSARQGVEHDDMNVQVLGSRVIGVELAREVVRAFLDADFTGEKRHRRRLAKVLRLEEGFCSGPGTGPSDTMEMPEDLT